MSGSDVELAAVTWRETRLRACAAPLGDPTVWTDLGAAETALSGAMVAHLEVERHRQELRDGAAAAKAAWDEQGGVPIHSRFASGDRGIETVAYDYRVAGVTGYPTPPWTSPED